MEGSRARRGAKRYRPADRLKQIREAAQSLAVEQGLHALTHRSLARSLGVSHSLVVHYVPELASLRAQTYGDLIRTELEEVQESIEGRGSALSKLAHLIDLLSVTGREDAAAVWLDGWSIGRLDDAMAQVVRQSMAEWQRFLEQIIEAGVAEGDFHVEDVSGCAWELIALLDGLNAHMLVRFGNQEDYRLRIASPIEARLSLPEGALVNKK